MEQGDRLKKFSNYYLKTKSKEVVDQIIEQIKNLKHDVSDEFGRIEKIIKEIIVELNQRNTSGVINKKKQKKLLGIL